MAQVEVVDHLLWTKRVHGEPKLKERLEALPAGSTVRLKVAGEIGSWRKMAPNKTTGAATPGLQPLGPAALRWREMFRAHKAEGGTLVDVELADDGRDPWESPRPAARWEVASPAERQAAWEAFKALWDAGWRSEAPYGPRDDLYDREPQ